MSWWMAMFSWRQCVLSAVGLLAAAAALAGSDVPSPAFLKSGYPIRLGDSHDVIWATADYHFNEKRVAEHFHAWWSPLTATLKKLTLPSAFVPEVAVSSPAGLVLVGSNDTYPHKADQPIFAMWLTPQGQVISAPLPIQRSTPRLVLLADRSVLLVGGKIAGKRTHVVERLSLAGDKLKVERLPDLPGVVRTGHAWVALGDGRAMALGGSSSAYIGCLGGECLTDTHVLDVNKKTWMPGPPMLEPRTDASATLLPDGSVLVAGGWTPSQGWSEGASRTTERWHPLNNRFVAGAPLPVGVAMHHTAWMAPGPTGMLLLWAGMVKAWEGNDTIMAYEVARDEWRTVGESCHADDKQGGLNAVLLATRQRPTMACEADQGTWRQVPLRVPFASSAEPFPDEGVQLNRGGTAFLPTQGDAPALVVGGYVMGGTFTASVDAIWSEGRTQSLASLNHPRGNAQVFRLPSGAVLVTGGVGGRANDRDTDRLKLPAEWSSGKPTLGSARWAPLDMGLAADTVLGQMPDGGLVSVSAQGVVERLTVTLTDAQKAIVQRQELPPLNRKRATSHDSSADKVVVKGLADGRVVVAGGDVQVNNIALLQDDSMQADAPDKYLGIGEYLPSRRHEIYDPLARAWHHSAPSRGAGGQVAILDDGRVVKLKRHKVIGEQKPDGSWPIERGFVEISSPDGQSWRVLEGPAGPRVRLDEKARPFVIQGELFLSGESELINTGGGASMVQWFNMATRQWETLWEAQRGDNWRSHLGRMVIRRLANGKQVTLPVGGL